MTAQSSYSTVLENPERICWRVEDFIGGEKRRDFSRPFLPEAPPRGEPFCFLSRHEKALLRFAGEEAKAIHAKVLKTWPDDFNVAQPVQVKSNLVIG